MRRRIFSIWSVLLILVVSTAVLVPGCGGGPTQSTIDVEATLNGAAWTGALQFTLLYGPAQPGAASPISGTTVPFSQSGVSPGSWTCGYYSGGPVGARFVDITPSATQNVSAGGTVTFTLNFVTPAAAVLDHFKGYWVEQGASVNVDVELEDQFGSIEATVTNPVWFCNPVEKTHDGEVTEIESPDHHLTVYSLDHEEEFQKWRVEVDNQFGEQELNVQGPVMLAVPTQKEGHNDPEDLDHFLLYYAYGPDLNVVVQLEDQFHSEPQVTVLRPAYFANPVQKTDATGMVTEIENPLGHLVFYEIPEELFQTDVNIVNQFGAQTLSLSGSYLLAVPSEKLSFGPPPPLDHFKFYSVVGGPDADVVLPQVEDQFYTGIQEVEVESLRYFGNPVAKTDDGVLTPIGDSDRHLALYDITTPTIQNWVVEVDNQFGLQELTVTGPVMLAVPTWKEGHGFPIWLDHFLLYKVIEGEDVQEVVDLEDQWHKESDVEVHRPVYFANPAGKASPYVDWNPGMPLIIENPDEHLVFYEIVGETYQGNVVILNQLLQDKETISVSDPELLAVPSEKISFEQVEQPLALDHFACYWIGEEWLPVQHGVLSLSDQFVDIEVAELGQPWYFCNPADKSVWGVLTAPILDPDHHLLFYGIHYQEEPGFWQVEVSNQFGWPQQLTVWGPVALAVPTHKLEPGLHDPPVDLDHFLLYEVVEGEHLPDLTVGLNDQFGYGEFVPGQPVFFANPVQKVVDWDIITPIENPEAHLVFYEIQGQIYSYPPIQVANQFGLQSYPVVWGPYIMAVPSVKLSAGQL